MQIYPYVQNRKRCPLSSLKWKIIPWSTHSKSPKDELIDILVDIPEILEDIVSLRTLSSQPEKQYLLRQAVEEKCWRCDRQLLSWSTSCGNATVAFVESLITAHSTEENSKNSAPPATDLAMAHLGMIYWTTYSLVSQMLSSLSGASPPGEDKNRLPPRIDAHLYSRKVALLIPYFKSPAVGSFLLSFIGFPVAVAASFLARQDSEGNFSEARALLVKAFHGERGSQLQRFLATWPWMTRSESDTLGAKGAQHAVE